MKLVVIGFVYFAMIYFNRKRVSPFLCYLVVFIIMAFQSNVRGDFYVYADNFLKNNQLCSNWDDLEVGWYWLTRIFGFSNFSVFYFFVALFEIWTLSVITKKYVPRTYWLLPAVLFFFDMNMMYFQMKGLRQALAIELGALSLYTIGKGVSIKNVILSLGLCLLAFSMHQTALLLVPFVLIYILMSKSNALCSDIKSSAYCLPLIFVALYFVIYLFKVNLVDKLLPLLFQIDLGGMEGYFGEMGSVEYSLLIDLIKGYFIFYVAYNLKYSYGIGRYLTILCLLGLYLDMFLFGMGTLFRIPLYLTIFVIVVYPNIANSLRRNNRKVESAIFILLSIAYAYRTFVTVSMRGMQDGLDSYRFMFEF